MTRPLFSRVAVTGGAGYVGSALVPLLLEAGYDVTVLDLFLYGDDVFGTWSGNPRLHLVKLDLRNEDRLQEALKGMDAVIHLACISNDPSFELDPRLGKSVNYDAFFGLLRAVRSNRVKRFIYASSSSVYGVKEQSNVTEETNCDPLTDYSKYKLLCEQALQSEGVGDCEWVVVRPATVCGYAQRLRLDLTVNILTIHALVKKEITVFGGAQLRPNLNIKDMIAAYRLLLEVPKAPIHGQTFNIGYQNRSVSELADIVRKEIGESGIRISVKPTDDLRSFHINSDRIKAALGFSPRSTIEDAVGSLCKAYRAGWMNEPLSNPRYYNIKTMQTLKLEEQFVG